jgi:hypothetical protein
MQSCHGVVVRELGYGDVATCTAAIVSTHLIEDIMISTFEVFLLFGFDPVYIFSHEKNVPPPIPNPKEDFLGFVVTSYICFIWTVSGKMSIKELQPGHCIAESMMIAFDHIDNLYFIGHFYRNISSLYWKGFTMLRLNAIFDGCRPHYNEIERPKRTRPKRISTQDQELVELLGSSSDEDELPKLDRPKYSFLDKLGPADFYRFHRPNEEDSDDILSSWLNDVCINTYLCYNVDRIWNIIGGDKAFTVHSSYFLRILSRDRCDPKKNKWKGHTCGKNINENDITKIDMIFIPVHKDGNHWALIVIFTEDRKIKHYDSFGKQLCKTILDNVKQYLEDSFESTNSQDQNNFTNNKSARQWDFEEGLINLQGNGEEQNLCLDKHNHIIMKLFLNILQLSQVGIVESLYAWWLSF